MTNNRSRLLLVGGILLVVGLLALFVPIAILLLAIGRVDDPGAAGIGVDPIGVVIGAVVGFGCFAAGSVILVRAALPPRSGQ
jgi:hypothetical protein